MIELASRPHVIADRYLTSPAALAACPFGPVDALDTHSGRGAQVRLVLVDGGWDEAGLAEAVARWCGIGCSEVCGVLDFGRHDDRWFLVLPPSLGLPVERWRALRRPNAHDAARLTLAFGRVVERIAAAGFCLDAASLADVAVGPGPTPFLERPCLQPAGARGSGDGQRLLAAVCDAALGSAEPTAVLGEWRERAHAARFADLGACLDELEHCGLSEASGAATPEEPPGLERLFDEDFDLDGPALTGPPPRRRWRLVAPWVTIGLLALSFLFGHVAHPGRSQVTPATSLRPTPVVAAPVKANRPAHGTVARSRKPHRTPTRTAKRHRHPHPTAPARSTATSAATAPAPSPAAPTSTHSSAGTTTLPAPGGTTLPAP
jgi:hypothetical protein